MKKYKKLIKLFIVPVIIMICILWYRKSSRQDNQLTENQAGINSDAGLETVKLLLELNSKALEEIEFTQKKEPSYKFFVKYGAVNPEDEDDSNVRIWVPFIMIEIPSDSEKEKRINQMLLEHYRTVLPDGRETKWWENQEPRITYRSERYLCFRYIASADMPEGYNDRDMYFTLDIEKERLIGYPVNEGQAGKFDPYRYGNLHNEMKEYQELTADEQSALLGDGKYDVKQIEAECDGSSFPCIEICGLSDKEMQEHINQVLQEPIRQVIENVEWEDKEKQQQILSNTKINISYQTQKWLSVVYSIRTRELPDLKCNDGIIHLGITVDMQSGERVMADDLFYEDRLIDWLKAMDMYGDLNYNSFYYDSYNFLIMTEAERIKEEDFSTKQYVMSSMESWNSFCLYKGKLIILRPWFGCNFEIPLLEIYEYLKVDPWYD